ncbi:AAA family ATPase (plasmid) [Latilactobacillus curvatus]|uniref:AAA family ATPase n=1 Tax=Latilactobacillus curvatus TaxID=28038 RepID=A0AAJ5RM78_LATCU|nr:UvrD-helicase domain-containing protein [Latilactobacillus curvatus]WDC92674.1 AAA family ATPase [Latilactobacillus curvatus]
MTTDFNQEQAHLSTVYQQLTTTLTAINDAQSQNQKNGNTIKAQITGEAKLNFDSYADNLDTFAALESINKEIDMLNLKTDSLVARHDETLRLLEQPYFAKITLTFPEEIDAEDFYLGSASFTNQAGDPVIYDWRSPIADVYYQQTFGPTSYQANGRAIAVNLDRRRQFQIQADQLIDFFDTQIAIEDPLLLATLKEAKTTQMSAITATIQKEQNAIIRQQTTDHLLIDGIAGSGKTSVIFQRIAYLLYRQRKELALNEVLMISLNRLFQDYIAQVLPDLGEQTPVNLTLQQLLAQLLPSDLAALPIADQPATLTITQLTLQASDFQSLSPGLPLTIDAATSYQFFLKTPVDTPLDKRIQATQQQLTSCLQESITNEAQSADALTQLESLTETEQQRLFDRLIREDEPLAPLARKMIRHDYQDLADQLSGYQWLAFDQIIARQTPIDAVIAAQIYAYLTHHIFPNVKQVFIDEVQDYHASTLSLFKQLFPKAQFTVFGDQHQSITPHKVQFEQLPTIFPQLQTAALRTSYRSSGAITTLFSQLFTDLTDVHAVQPAGKRPTTICTTDFNDYLTQIQAQIDQLPTDQTLAIITPAGDFDERLTGLKNVHHLSTETTNLPETGAFTLPLTLAKGLEFDNVLLYDLTNNYYTEPTVGHNRLYTAISRATHQLTLSALGKLPVELNGQ